MKSAWFATQADMIETMHKALNDDLKPADLELEKRVGPKVKRQLAAARSILDQRNDMIQQQKRARIAMAKELAQVDILERRIEKLELGNGQQDRALGVACQAFDTVTGQYEMLQELAKIAVQTWPTAHRELGVELAKEKAIFHLIKKRRYLDIPTYSDTANLDPITGDGMAMTTAVGTGGEQAQPAHEPTTHQRKGLKCTRVTRWMSI